MCSVEGGAVAEPEEAATQIDFIFSQKAVRASFAEPCQQVSIRLFHGECGRRESSRDGSFAIRYVVEQRMRPARKEQAVGNSRAREESVRWAGRSGQVLED